MTNWHIEVIACLQELADIELQRRTWVEKTQLSLADPGELVCQLFDDTGLDDMLAVEGVFSAECDSILRDLSQAIANVNLQVPGEVLLADPAWLAIVEKAKLALSSIKKCLS